MTRRRSVPIVLAGALLSLAATGGSAQALADGAATKSQYDKSVERQKARKATAASTDPQKADRLAPKPVAQRPAAPADAPAAVQPAPAATDSFHDCQSSNTDA